MRLAQLIGSVEEPARKEAKPRGSAKETRGPSSTHDWSGVAPARAETVHMDRDAEPTGAECQLYGPPGGVTSALVEYLIEKGGQFGGGAGLTDLSLGLVAAGRVAALRY